jgi:hypothetical protein
LHVDKSGASGNLIYIKRPRTTDPDPVAAAGWSAGFDSQVIINPSTYASCIYWDNGTNGSYVTIDGRTDYGVKAVFPLPASCPDGGNPHFGAIAFAGNAAPHDVTINHVEAVSAGTPTCGDTAGINAFADGPIYNLTVSHCSIHKFLNLIRSIADSNPHAWTLEYLDLSDCPCVDTQGANGGDHGNMFQFEHIHDSTLRYCRIHDWTGQGFNINSVNVPMNWYIYGNVWYSHTGNGNCSSSAFWNCIDPSGHPATCNGTSSGPMYWYNNTFYGTAVTAIQSGDVVFGNGSVTRNNIFWNSSQAHPIADADYNLYSGTATGTHSINAQGTCPFPSGCLNTNTDFRIKTNVSALYPKDKGTAITNISGQTFNTDANGSPRPDVLSGLWDMGAYEDQNPGTSPIQSPSKTLTFPKLWP